MATIPAIEERIRALRAKGRARTLEESVELGRCRLNSRRKCPPGISTPIS